MRERIIEEEKVVLRHSPIELIEHWVLALSGLALIFSGFGELPMYKRFMVTKIPGLSWAGDFLINLQIHYLSGIVFVSIIVFHAVYHGWLGHQGLLPKKGDITASIKTILSMFGFGEEPPSHKYLPEQRLAYAYLGGIGLILVFTGLIKVIKNLPGVFLPPQFITAVTLIHTFATIFFLLGVLAHLAALIFKVNRPLAKSIFTKKVDLDYVKKRHPLWYQDLLGEGEKVEVKEIGVEEVGPSEESETKPEAERMDQRTEGKEGLEKETVMSVLKVKGMSCQHCVMAVTRALSQLEGIQNIQVNLEKGEVRFENPKAIPEDQIEKAITVAGYEVIRKDQGD